MIFSEKTSILKNGKTAIFRSPRAEDAAQMVEYLVKTAGETDFLARYPEEWNGLTVEKEAALLADINRSPLCTMIVCEVDGRVAGNCQIVFNGKQKMAHRATVMIALLKEFWGLGIGTFMFESMEEIAREKGVMQMELEVIEGNERAMSLYKKAGFSVVAEKPRVIRLKDGTLLSEFIMIKVL